MQVILAPGRLRGVLAAQVAAGRVGIRLGFMPQGGDNSAVGGCADEGVVDPVFGISPHPDSACLRAVERPNDASDCLGGNLDGAVDDDGRLRQQLAAPLLNPNVGAVVILGFYPCVWGGAVG